MKQPRNLALAIALAVGSGPVFAQEMDHSQMQMPAPKAAAKPVPAEKKPPPKKPAARPATPKAAVDPHAGHAMPPSKPTPPAPQKPAPAPPVDHAAMGHEMPAPKSEPEQPVDHSAMDHDTPPAQPAEEMDHSAMDHDMPMGEDAMPDPDLPATAPPIEPIPLVTPADRVAAFPDVAGHTVHDNGVNWFALLDRIETWDADEGDALHWEGSGWIGTDLDRVWLRSEGEAFDGSVEEASVEVMYGRAIAPWWDAVVGLRHDFGDNPSHTFAAVGVIGLAPYMFEVQATAYFGESGQTGLGLEAEYETLITNRLILQSGIEAEFWGKDDPRHGIGSGLGTIEASFRLRYEFTRQFAPYIGIVRERLYGGTADLRRTQGGETDDTRVVIGLRTWF